MKIINLVETTCLYKYPWSTTITFDGGSEFLGHEFKNIMIQREYGKNPDQEHQRIQHLM